MEAAAEAAASDGGGQLAAIPASAYYEAASSGDASFVPLPAPTEGPAAPPTQMTAPMLPFNPPEAVQRWLRREDWEALSQAWAEAEAKAISWAEGDYEDLEAEMWQEEHHSRSNSQASTQSPSRKKKSQRKRQPWDEGFHLLGQDSRRPAPMRRYFDDVPGENAEPNKSVRPGMRKKPLEFKGGEDSHGGLNPIPGQWNAAWNSSASTDNDGLHPHLRHYFDKRGLEASYKQRPHCDHQWLKGMRPRTPGRPSTRDKLLKWSTSAPELELDELDVKGREKGNIHWGTRCMRYGPDSQTRRSPNGEKIPWVYDHNRSETEDNEMMNPVLRHYFDADGIESSFRNRGRHYGRPPKMMLGLQWPGQSQSTCSLPGVSSPGSNGSRSIHGNSRSVGGGSRR